MRRCLFCFLVGFLACLVAKAQQPTVDGDTISISLLTCQPHDEVYSLYGHTALRFRSTSGKMDWAVNYGVFDYATPNFALRFALGKTDYILGVFPFDEFGREYDHYGSSITEQHLNLTKAEKERIYAAMYNNAQPANREYRYNFFYDNCTTRARNLVQSNLDGTVKWAHAMDAPAETFRDIIHRYNGGNLWSRFGCDLLLGIGADKTITKEQAQFLPDNLMADFDSAKIRADDGRQRPLVARTTVIKAHHPPMESGHFPVRPRTCAWILLVVTLMFTAVEQRLHRNWWAFDLLLLSLSGLAGLVLAFMIFSEHPTVSVNLQILILNPLAVVFCFPALRRLAHGRRHWLWGVLTVCLLAGMVGSQLQHYAEGMLIIAASLLIRTALHARRLRE